MHSKLPLVWVVGATLALSACFDELEKNQQDPNDDGNVALNQPPTITGAPPAHILEGEFYEFMPSANDPDHDQLEFSVSRKPAWANFDNETGRLWGTPTVQDVGNFTNIAISVTDGKETANLSAFDISVNSIAAGTATLSWMPPTENADGTALTDLAGYRIYYGRNSNNLDQIIVVDNAGLTRYVVENLTPARWHFAISSVNTGGSESERSGIASKTIS